jgi:hypothetical protein
MPSFGPPTANSVPSGEIANPRSCPVPVKIFSKVWPPSLLDQIIVPAGSWTRTYTRSASSGCTALIHARW